MTNKTRLELTWIGKEKRPRLEPRILLEDLSLSYHADRRVSESDVFDNRLIFGDNLLALKALEQEFTGEVKCIYIDPPFNTGQAFEHYDDAMENSGWLSLMRDRLVLLRRLLRPDGSFYVHIDDTQLGYIIVLLDEIFGRANRVSVISFKQGSATGHKSINPGCVTTTNFVLVYAKDKAAVRLNRVYTARDRDKRYAQFIVNRDDPYQAWHFVTLSKALAAELGMAERDAKRLPDYEERLDAFVLENPASVSRLARPDFDAVSEAARGLIQRSRENPGEVFLLTRDGYSDMYFRGGERVLFYSDKLKLIDGRWVAGEPLTTLWDDLLSNNLHNEGGVAFPKGKKPEALVKRIFEMATEPGDLVLDSFAGSGTTGAVAHKMKRRWIQIELGEHALTHIVPRLRAVVDGTDTGGITAGMKWKGGGGFRFFRLAPSLLEKDSYGNWIVSKQYNPAMLAEAVCKHEGFTYSPSDTLFWQQGQSSERDFIYVTTQTLSREQLAQLSEDVGQDRSLLVCCAAYRARADEFPNLTIKKIPHAVLNRCEWGRDDYSLAVSQLQPFAEEAGKGDPEDVGSDRVPLRARRRKTTSQEPTLFNEEES